MADKKISQLSSYSPINDKVIFPMSYVTSDNKFKTGHTSAKDIKDFVFTYVNENIDIPEVDLTSYASLSYVEDNYIGKGEALTSVDTSKNTFKIGNNDYVLTNIDGVLSIQEDIPVTFSSFSVNPTSVAVSGGNVSRDTDYVGKSYTGGTIQKTVNDTNITLTASVSNPQGKTFTYEFKNESGTVIYSGTSTGTSVSYTVKQRDYFNDGPSVTVADGTFTWANRTASSAISCKSNKNTSGDGAANETFSCKINSTTKTAKVTGGQSCTFTAKAKVPFMYGTNGQGSGCTTLIQDITCGSVPGSFDKNYTFAAGNIPVFAIPSCLGKTLKCFNDTGALEDSSLKKDSTQTLTLNGCTTDYDIYIYAGGAWVDAATIKVKF